MIDALSVKVSDAGSTGQFFQLSDGTNAYDLNRE